MHASMSWAILVAGMVLVPSGAEAISYTFSDCQQTQLCGAPASQPESTQSVSPTYDFSNEAAVAASIASVYFSSDGALTSMTQFDRGTTTDTSDPSVMGPTLSTAMAFDDIITALDAGSSTADGLRVSAHLQGMDPNASLDIYMARESFSVPEPAMVALFGLTLIAAAARVRRKR
jgi:hypothetical protein